MSTSQWNNIKEDSTSTQQSCKFNLPKKSILKHTINKDKKANWEEIFVTHARQDFYLYKKKKDSYKSLRPTTH